MVRTGEYVLICVIMFFFNKHCNKLMNTVYTTTSKKEWLHMQSFKHNIDLTHKVKFHYQYYYTQ